MFANTQVGIANGIASATNPGYPDALTGGAFMPESNGPIVLVGGKPVSSVPHLHVRRKGPVREAEVSELGSFVVPRTASTR